MSLYLLIAVVTTTLAAIVDRSNKRGVRIALMVVITLVFCYFASARDVSVGTDTTTYGYNTYEGSRVYPFDVYMSSQVYDWWGFLYKLVAWVSSNLFKSFQGLLFTIALCTVAPVVFVGYKFTNRRLALAVAVYALFFYPLSFNLIRQSIAMSVLLLAWYELYRKRYLGFLIWLVVAANFHSSAWLGILLILFYWYAHPSRTSTEVKTILLLVAGTLMLLATPYVSGLISQHVPRYAAYVGEGHLVVEGHGYRNIVEYITIFVILTVFWQMFRDKSPTARTSAARQKTDGLFFVVLFGQILNALSPLSVNLSRVGMYFLYFAILLIPASVELIPKKSERVAFDVLSIVAVALVAVDVYAITGQAEVVPYVFSPTRVI